MPAMPISCSRSVLRANSLLVLIAISATTLLLSNSREPPAFAQTSVSAVDVVIPWSGEPENDHSGANRDDGILKYELRSIVKKYELGPHNFHICRSTGYATLVIRVWRPGQGGQQV